MHTIGNINCWRCFNEGFIVVNDSYVGKKVIACPACENRRLIREHKERLNRKIGKFGEKKS